MKFSSYFFKYAKKEKKNFIASVFTFLALFASLQALLGFCTAAVKTIYFYNPGFREDCYYSMYGGGAGESVPKAFVGSIWNIETSEQSGGIVYKAEVSEPCVTKNLGFMVSDRVYLLPKGVPDISLPKDAPYSIAYNISDPADVYMDEGGKAYPLAGTGSLKRNDPLMEQLKSMRFSWVGFVALIDPNAERTYGASFSVVLGHGEELGSSFASGAILNEQYRNGRKQLPSLFYAGFLIPFILELSVAFGIMASLDRKAASEIFSLRLIGVPLGKCYSFLFFRRFMEAVLAFLASFIVAFPILLTVLPGFTPALLIGEGVAFLYVLLSILISTSSYAQASFYRKKKGCRHA